MVRAVRTLGVAAEAYAENFRPADADPVLMRWERYDADQVVLHIKLPGTVSGAGSVDLYLTNDDFERLIADGRKAWESGPDD